MLIQMQIACAPRLAMLSWNDQACKPWRQLLMRRPGLFHCGHDPENPLCLFLLSGATGAQIDERWQHVTGLRRRCGGVETGLLGANHPYDSHVSRADTTPLACWSLTYVWTPEGLCCSRDDSSLSRFHEMKKFQVEIQRSLKAYHISAASAPGGSLLINLLRLSAAHSRW